MKVLKEGGSALGEGIRGNRRYEGDERGGWRKIWGWRKRIKEEPP